MNKIDLIIDLAIGTAIGILAAAIGSYLFILVFTDFSFLGGLQIMKSEGKLGKIITLGALLNLLIFFFLLKTNKENIAKGLIVATILLTLFTLLV